jgi:hypothetical protein
MNIVQYVDLALQRGQILDLMRLYGTNKEIHNLLNNSDKLRYLSAIVKEPVISFRDFVIKYMKNLIDNLNIDNLVLLADLYFGDSFVASFLDSPHVLNKLKNKFESKFITFKDITIEREVYDFVTFGEFIIYYLLIEIYKREMSLDFVDRVKELSAVEEPDSIVSTEMLSTYDLENADMLDDRVNMLASNEETNKYEWQAMLHILDNELSELHNILDNYLLELINEEKFTTYLSLVNSFNVYNFRLNDYFLRQPDIPLSILAEILYYIYQPKEILEELVKTRDVEMISYMVKNFKDFNLNSDLLYTFHGVISLDNNVNKQLFETGLSLETILLLYNIITKETLEIALKHFGTENVIETLEKLDSVKLFLDDKLVKFIFEPLKIELLLYISDTEKFYTSDEINANILYSKLSELVKNNDVLAVKALTKLIDQVFFTEGNFPSESVLRKLLQTAIVNAIDNDEVNILRWVLVHFQQKEFYIRINDLLQKGLVKAQNQNKMEVANIIQNYLHDKM